jgi:O-antigen/teichoic acid export membrane protein
MSWGPFALSMRDRVNSGSLYAVAFTGIVSVMCFITVAVSLLSPEIVRIGTSPKYAEAADFVPYLGMSVIAIGAYNLWSTGATLAGKSEKLMEAVIIGALCNVTLNIVLIKSLGILGSVLANVFACIAMAIVVLINSQKCWPIPYEKWRIAVILIGAGLTMLIGNVLHYSEALRFGLFSIYSVVLFMALKPSRVIRLLSLKPRVR